MKSNFNKNFLNHQFSSDAIFINNSKLSFHNFKKEYLNIYNYLNIPKKKKIIIDIKNPELFIKIVFAVLESQSVPCLWNFYFQEDFKNKILSENSYDAVISDYREWNELPTIILNPDFHFLSTPRKQNTKIDLSQKLVIYTSGSTSPKACVLSLKQMFFNAQASHLNIPFENSDTWGHCLPTFHIGGFSIFIRAIYKNAKIHFINLKNLDPESLNITHISLVSSQLQRLQINPFPKLKFCLIGGSSISQDLYNSKLNDFPLYASYGMTEASSQVATSQLKELNLCILKNIKIKIINNRISIRGPTVFDGYLIFDKLIKPFKNKYFITNDLGEVKNNILKVYGRSDRIFQSGGENISCEYIESVLLKIPGIKKAHVTKKENKEYGYVPIAYLEHTFKSIKELIRNISPILNNELPGLMRPKEFYNFSDNKNLSWKILS